MTTVVYFERKKKKYGGVPETKKCVDFVKWKVIFWDDLFLTRATASSWKQTVCASNDQEACD